MYEGTVRNDSGTKIVRGKSRLEVPELFSQSVRHHTHWAARFLKDRRPYTGNPDSS